MLNGEITYDMTNGVRGLLNELMNSKETAKQDENLRFHTIKDNLVVQTVIASLVSPSEIGCEFF